MKCSGCRRANDSMGQSTSGRSQPAPSQPASSQPARSTSRWWVMTLWVVWMGAAWIAPSAIAQNRDRGGGGTNAKRPPAKPKDAPEAKSKPAAGQTPSGFVLTDDVRQALLPLFKRVNSAKVTRTTVEMLNDSLINGVEVDRRTGTFQIASKSPGKFTIYLKEPDRRTRLYCNGERLVVALAPDAYVDLGEAIELQEVVTNVPVIMGTYPEPVLALSVAGVDPAVSFLGGMESLRLADRRPYGDANLPAIHLVGTQADGVTWDLWIRDDDKPEPLRMLVDLTPMLLQSGKVNLPAGYSQQIRYNFLSYRTEGDVSDGLFEYRVKPESQQYDSIGDYYRGQAEAAAIHPTTGQPAPPFRAMDLAGKVVDTRKLGDRVLVIDFWASWCKPCLEALPVYRGVVEEFDSEDVAFLSVNTGQSRKEVQQFVRERKMTGQTLLDSKGKIADGYQADRIPQTTVVGRDGKVFRVLTGFSDPKDAAERMRKTIQAALDG